MSPAAGTPALVLRRRVSLSGHVARADGRLVPGGLVRLLPAETPVPTETEIRADGRYVFLDIAAGTYTLGGHDDRNAPLAPRQVDVPAEDRTKYPPLLAFDLVVADPASPGSPPAAAAKKKAPPDAKR